ncbi:ribbon-helix-helix domain-containing protein [Nitratifractor sp.]
MAVVKKLISFEEGVARELERVSKALGTTQKDVIERALDFYFDHTDAILAEKISNEIREGKVKVHDADEVFKELGVE